MEKDPVAKAKPVVSPLKHALTILKYVREKTDKIILFYSGGKDSIVLLDMLPSLFNEVHCVFMYLVKDLEHQQPLINFAKRYKNVTMHQYPHWMLSHYYKNGHFSFHQSGAEENIPLMYQKDIEAKARIDTGCEWMVTGEKRSDSLKRYMLLGMFKYDGIVDNKKHIYPLSHWKKADIFAYIRNKRLIRPVSYNPKMQSEGVDLDLDVLLYLREHYPQDVQKIFNQFPFAEKILFEYDYENSK